MSTVDTSPECPPGCLFGCRAMQVKSWRRTAQREVRHLERDILKLTKEEKKMQLEIQTTAANRDIPKVHTILNNLVQVRQRKVGLVEEKEVALSLFSKLGCWRDFGSVPDLVLKLATTSSAFRDIAKQMDARGCLGRAGGRSVYCTSEMYDDDMQPDVEAPGPDENEVLAVVDSIIAAAPQGADEEDKNYWLNVRQTLEGAVAV
eukprot:TRINITY_DN59529_c0_g2_i2.p1 TRINITY_DN59529_c0_g2~~TRINITY_DN59529_c0_g2_i2.p1  ORF type:complete len:204 (-),score=15.00 TRINITY_DN59529_c0_g2_i2:360-971(-)